MTKGLKSLTFHANQFMGQAPGSAEESINFVASHCQTSFPRFAKSRSMGKEAPPSTNGSKNKLSGPWTPALNGISAKFLIDRKAKSSTASLQKLLLKQLKQV